MMIVHCNNVNNSYRLLLNILWVHKLLFHEPLPRSTSLYNLAVDCCRLADVRTIRTHRGCLEYRPTRETSLPNHRQLCIETIPNFIYTVIIKQVVCTVSQLSLDRVWLNIHAIKFHLAKLKSWILQIHLDHVSRRSAMKDLHNAPLSDSRPNKTISFPGDIIMYLDSIHKGNLLFPSCLDRMVYRRILEQDSCTCDGGS